MYRSRWKEGLGNEAEIAGSAVRASSLLKGRKKLDGADQETVYKYVATASSTFVSGSLC